MMFDAVTHPKSYIRLNMKSTTIEKTQVKSNACTPDPLSSKHMEKHKSKAKFTRQTSCLQNAFVLQNTGTNEQSLHARSSDLKNTFALAMLVVMGGGAKFVIIKLTWSQSCDLEIRYYK